MALADDDPYVEQLLGDASTAQPRRCPRRELRAELGAAAPCCSPRSPRWRSWRRPRAALSPLGRARRSIAAYALAQQVQFDVGPGYTVPSQLVLMPMLLLAPPALVPLLVAAGLLVGRLPCYLRGDVHPTRLAFVLADAWLRGRARRWSWPLLAPGAHRPRRLARAGRSPSSRRRSATPA